LQIGNIKGANERSLAKKTKREISQGGTQSVKGTFRKGEVWRRRSNVGTWDDLDTAQGRAEKGQSPKTKIATRGKQAVSGIGRRVSRARELNAHGRARGKRTERRGAGRKKRGLRRMHAKRGKPRWGKTIVGEKTKGGTKASGRGAGLTLYKGGRTDQTSLKRG